MNELVKYDKDKCAYCSETNLMSWYTVVNVGCLCAECGENYYNVESFLRQMQLTEKDQKDQK